MQEHSISTPQAVQEKRCSKCGQVKPLAEFACDRTKPTGRTAYCRACMAEYRAANRRHIVARTRRYQAANRDSVLRWKRAYREANGDRIRAYGRAYYAANKSDIWAKELDYSARHPERRAAKSAVKNAVKRGALPRVTTQFCFMCGKPAEQYHHPDYSKPLEVIPVCRSCHMRWHAAMRGQE